MDFTKRVFCFIVFGLLIATQMQAQKVGLVLSGGGAKGLTHIGIIRALEENNIPIDYVTGTSIGAIVGSLYAMGYSPDEMMELIGSDEFKRWYTGKVEDKYIYYFKTNPPTSEFFNIRLSLGDSIKGSPLLPSSLVNPIQMNLAFIELFAPATAAANGDFDNLFIPFRCIASDVYNKKQLVLSKGDLGDAVRASMSFPAMFKPIEINDILVYDGGIYNNFPTDVMKQDFNPDIIIGSVVSSNPGKPNERDFMSQIENMVMQKTDYSLHDSLGILLTFSYEDVSLMDFDRLQELHDIGYNRTMSIIDSIKTRIPRRVSEENLNLRRLVYKSNLPDLLFKNISIEGAGYQQRQYIKKEFQEHENEVFTFEDLKLGYFRLLSDNIISEIIPHATYNPKTNYYDLKLKVKLEDKLSVSLGGSVSSSSSNQIYFGVSYQDLNYYSKEFIFDGQLGKIYNNVQISARVDFPTNIPTSYKFIASVSTFDYFKDNNLFSDRDQPALTKKKEKYLKLKTALPFLSKKKVELGFGIAQIEDQYSQSQVIDFSDLNYDKSTYLFYGGNITFEGSTLNTKQYPTQGIFESMIAQIYRGNEKYTPGKKESANKYEKTHTWLQFAYKNQTYVDVVSKFIFGVHAEAFYSSKNFSENYTATLMQAGEFTPTAHSRLAYNEAFRANQYLGAGIIPIYQLNNLFHLRGEFYGFMPILPIEANSINKPYYGKAFSRFRYMGEVSLVCHLPFGAISAYVNHYSSPKRNWNAGITLGWQLFNTRFIE